jgi:biopolymer transport protein ExbB/TolQ
MSIALLAPIIGSTALCVAIAGWDAAVPAVFARRHFEQPRERLIAWARECGEAFELLMIPGCEILK